VTDTIKVEGAVRLATTLRVASNRVEDMRGPGSEAGRYVAARGRSDAPHRTGRLAASIRSSATRSEAEISSGLPYANRTHWGYRRYGQAAQPFLARNVENNERQIVDMYADRVDLILHTVKGA
jgi:hypothetical protein